jgi:hypothetical protein
MPYRDVELFYETSEGNSGLEQMAVGCMFFDRQKETYTLYQHDSSNVNSPAGNVIVSLSGDKFGRLWIGYYLEGLDCFDEKRLHICGRSRQDKGSDG